MVAVGMIDRGTGSQLLIFQLAGQFILTNFNFCFRSYSTNFGTNSRIRRIELLIEPGQSLGLMIRGGVEYGLGIFITGVDKDSVADRAGLTV